MSSLFIVFVKCASQILVWTPRSVQVALGRLLGLTWFYLVPIRRRTAIENLKIAFPEWTDKKRRQTARANYMNYGCGFIEFMLLPRFTPAVFEKHFRVDGWENFENARAQEKGIFLLTLHIGSWELMSAASQHLKIPLHVITKKFKAQSLNRMWVELRVTHGLKLIEESKSTFQILRVIRNREAVGFILDQFTGPPIGTEVEFFGKKTGAAAALALFSDRTRAPVIPVYNIRDPDGRIRIVFEPEVPFMEQGSTEKNISFMTQVYTSKIEEIVRKYPEQWLWIHRRWKEFRR